MASSSTDLTSPSAQPSLDTLVSYLLTAKRSLSTVDTVFKANELVTSSKAAFVEQTATTARTSYLRSGCAALYSHLAQMHAQLGSVASDSAAEFDEVIAGVSAAERRLQGTLEGLRATIVDAKLRPHGEEEAKSLLDFVDRGAMQGLLDEVRENVSETEKAREHYDKVVEKLGIELRSIKVAILRTRSPAAAGEAAGGAAAENRSNDNGDDDNDQEIGNGTATALLPDDIDEQESSPVPAILHSMEASAHDMAENLESLVKHYDLCLDVLRHTEGAGAAFRQVVAARSDLPAEQNAAMAHEIGSGDGGGGDAAGLDGSFPAPGTPDRAHLMQMLASDAGQVEEVVAEIQAGLAALEAAVERVEGHGARLRQRYGRVRDVYASLEAAEGRLPHYSTQSHLYVVRLDGAKAAIADKRAALAELAAFYAGFLSAYDRLVIEVGRRKDMARRMKRIRDEATARLDQLFLEDQEERELFRRTHGEFLPRDIWPGLSAPPPRYEVALVEGEGSVPDISASVVQRAIRRVSGRPEGKREKSG